VRVKVYQDILEANERLAELNRRTLDGHGVVAANLIGAPGCGKTTLLEATLARLADRTGLRAGVIEGDLETSRDADRIARCNVPAVQINTQGGCHLDAAMLQAVLADFPLREIDLLFIENVGNLVCPADYDLGEHFKVALVSLPEGDDKPAKYPIIFRRAEAALITKMDLIEHVEFDLEEAVRHMRIANPDLAVFSLSARSGQGMDEWIGWLEARVSAARSAAEPGGERSAHG